MNQKLFSGRYQGFLLTFVGIVVCLGTVYVAAQEAPSRSFPDSPFLRIDPEKIRGAEVCGECHAEEAQIWRETKHQTQFATLHQSEKAQGILDRMGFQLAKRESLCLRCHYTATIRRDQARASTGVSCESCHGAGRDWIDIHNDYGGAEREDESEDHKIQRIRQSIENGMLRPTGDIYAVAANCFECHTVPDERLINEGGHPSGSAVELVAWSDSIRHNFLAAQWSRDRTNRVPDAARRRLMFVVGQILDYEYSLRGLATATKRSPYSKAMERRAKVSFRGLKNLFEATTLPELKELLDIGNGVTLGPENETELLAAADQFEPIVGRLTAAHDWANLDSVDEMMSGRTNSEPTPDPGIPIAGDGDTLAGDDASVGDATGENGRDPDTTNEGGADAANAAPVVGGAAVQGQIRARPAWFSTEQFQTTVPGCSCHTSAEDWLLDDPHSQSLDLMNSPRAVQIAQIYGIDPGNRLQGNQICMSCHGTVISGDERDEVFDPVSCESCHGPSSGYLDPHERGGGIGFTLGQRELKNADIRLAMCAQCHYITDDRLLSAGHPSGEDYEASSASASIKHWPDTKNVERDSPYPEVSPAALTAAFSAVQSARPRPTVTVVQVEEAPTTPSIPSSAPPIARPTPSGTFQSPRVARTVRTLAPGALELPPLPTIDDSVSTEELLLIIKRRLEIIYQSLGRGN